ncbi:S41 family peptidase [Fontisphaera persica]|uniref:S41 family peptidase n=1 Tax=Fontisphaera persica TaxID=2974023 RepID=UPI0024BF2860|nr:S41 family peptidase [Fontisphaera persica]WCJ60865.1 S41 family peptidase [Fontisphaera persica]
MVQLWMLLAAGAAVAAGPSLQELREVLRKHLEGVDESMIEEAAVEGVLRRFSNQVMLVTPPAAKPANTYGVDTNAPPAAQPRVYEDQFGYLRIQRLEDNTVEEITRQLTALCSSNQLKGLVLDLRFATGRDLAAAGRLAQWFVGRGRPLMAWKGQKIVAPPEAPSFQGPLAVLVNGQTKGAPEVLAAILREQVTAVLIGGPTRGDTAEYREVNLSNGQILRLAVAAVTLGESQPLKPGGLRPDIPVVVSEREERAYLDNPYRPGEGGAETASRPRLNEAELVRMKREATESEGAVRSRLPARVEPPNVVRDPALARGLDLLKGLSVLKLGRGS